MKKMLFAKTYHVDGKTYNSGEIYPIEETPGSIDRWIRRGCKIIKEEIIKEEVKEEIIKEIKEEIKEEEVKEKKIIKKVLKKRSK